MLPPKQRIKLYQPRSKLEQFEDILIESQLLEQAMPDLAGSPLDYDKFEMEGLGLTRYLICKSSSHNSLWEIIFQGINGGIGLPMDGGIGVDGQRPLMDFGGLGAEDNNIET